MIIDRALVAMMFLIICILLGGLLGFILVACDKHSHSHHGNGAASKPDPSSKLPVVTASPPPPGFYDPRLLRGRSSITYKKPDSDSIITGK